MGKSLDGRRLFSWPITKHEAGQEEFEMLIIFLPKVWMDMNN